MTLQDRCEEIAACAGQIRFDVLQIVVAEQLWGWESDRLVTYVPRMEENLVSIEQAIRKLRAILAADPLAEDRLIQTSQPG